MTFSETHQPARDEKQAAFIKAYENLLNQLADDEAIVFADAVHPTHAVRPVGCWTPKDVPAGKPPSEPKFTSLTDPAAAWTNKGQMKVVFAYGDNYLIDTKAAIILDVEATPARWQREVAATKTMLVRTEETFGLKPARFTANTAYGSGLMIGWLMHHGITPHVPILDREHQTKGLFTRRDFTSAPPGAPDDMESMWSTFQNVLRPVR